MNISHAARPDQTNLRHALNYVYNRTMTVLVCILIGLAAGVAGGLFGIGGGILIVPALILAFGFGQQKAQGTSLVALLAPVGILAVKNYYDKEMIDFQKGGIIALAFFGGAYLGSKIAVDLDPITMRRLFAGFLAVTSLYLFFKPN